MAKGHFMPLHDHPGMTVFIKLLEGEILLKTYEFIHKDTASSQNLDFDNAHNLISKFSEDGQESMIYSSPNMFF